MPTWGSDRKTAMPLFETIVQRKEAVQWTGTNLADILKFVGRALPFNAIKSQIFIPTLEGEMTADLGD